MELDERRDLRAQDLRHDRHRQVVHGAAFVAAQPVELSKRDTGDEDDGRPLETRVFADHLRQLEPVELRHADVHDHDRAVVPQQAIERLARRVRRNQVRVDALENRPVAEELGGLVVDEQDVRVRVAVPSGPSPLTGAATSAARTAVDRC